MKYPEKVERRPDRIPDVRYPDGMSAEKNSRCDTSRWNERCHTSQGGRLRVQGVGTPSPDDTERASLSEQLHPDSLRGYVARSPIQTPLGRSTRHSQSSHLDDSISYLDMLSGSLAKVHKPCYVISTTYHSPRSAALRWCVRICLWQRTLKLRFFMFLSFPLLCHGFQITLFNLGLLW